MDPSRIRSTIPAQRGLPPRGPRPLLRAIAAALFIGAGANHFRSTAFYRQIVPPMFPAPAALVTISGLAEIAGGIGLLIPRLRRCAGWGLIVLLVAVFPANLYMALTPQAIAGVNFPRWALWARLPLQPVLILWVWYAALPRRPVPDVGELS